VSSVGTEFVLSRGEIKMLGSFMLLL